MRELVDAVRQVYTFTNIAIAFLTVALVRSAGGSFWQAVGSALLILVAVSAARGGTRR